MSDRGRHGRAAKRLSIEEARDTLRRMAGEPEAVERIATTAACGRILALPVAARCSVPHFHAAAMDGIAVRSPETSSAGQGSPVELHAGGAETSRFQWVDTGNPLPAWADAVIMVEAVEPIGETQGSVRGAGAPSRPPSVRIAAPATPWQHVRVVGEDVVAGEELLPAGHRLRPHDVGLLLAAGVVEVAMQRRPVVAILPTGDELIEADSERTPGKIVDSNSHMIAAWAEEWGAVPLRWECVADDVERIAEAVRTASREADVILVLSGSSAGSRDFTASALARVGQVVAHGIELVPGRPTILAAVDAAPPSSDGGVGGEGRGHGRDRVRGRVAIGVPGYPVAAAMVCREIIGPLVRHLSGSAAGDPGARLGGGTVRAVSTEALDAKPGLEELVRVEVGCVGEVLVARPLARGAGALAALSRATGLVRLRPDAAPIAAGDPVDVELLGDARDADSRDLGPTVLAAGLVDPLLEALNRCAGRPPRFRIATRAMTTASAVGSLANGSAAAVVLARATASAASDVHAELSRLAGEGLPARVLSLARRMAGLVVAPGNPLGLRDLADLARADARPCPPLRRGGRRAEPPAIPPLTGTRKGMATSERSDDELPPLAAAAAVQSGMADFVWGTAWTAATLGLDFVPLVAEDVLLIVRTDLVSTPLGTAVVDALRGDDFRSLAALLAGYDLATSGREIVLG